MANLRLADLPHLCRTTTNLDKAEYSAMASIKSELRLLMTAYFCGGEQTTLMINVKLSGMGKNIEELLPHLFIISDEFGGVEECYRAGIHAELTLLPVLTKSWGAFDSATQKPSGVVDDQI